MAANAFSFAQKRPIRSAPNLYDKSTVVSIFPQRIFERKWTLEPGLFELAPGSKTKPSILVVGPSSWWKDLHQENSILEIPTGSALIAESVVRDYCQSMVAYTDNMGPGLFHIPGRALKSEDVLSEFKDKVQLAATRQKRWYEELVKLADALWSKSNGNPRVVDDLCKLAANELQIKDKPWMAIEQQVQLVNCPACGSLRKEEFPICGTCKTIVDPEKYKKLGLSQAL